MTNIGFDKRLDYAEKSVLKVINAIVDATVVFYGLQEQVKPRDLKRELFVNLVTNFMLTGELYFLLFNLTSSHLEEPL